MRPIDMLTDCHTCPRGCGADRNNNGTGYCGIGRRAVMASYGPHHGEEPPLSGWRGSGTVFFSGCNLMCVYCQNHDISQEVRGQPCEPEDLAGIMLSLERFGCHNVNLVSPSHVGPQVIEAVMIARESGLSVPIVYNTGGYDSVKTLRHMEGIVDIYMPDMKYSDPAMAARYSDAPDYPEVNRRAVIEMHRQVGDLETDRRGIAVRGLLVRHLVLPHDIAGTERTVRFLAEEVSSDTYVNIMDQYRPCHRSREFPELGRGITRGEFDTAERAAIEAGLYRIPGRLV